MDYTQDVKNRLRRVEGQIHGIIKMIEEGSDCQQVVTQLSASRAAINRTLALIVSQNLESCIRKQISEGHEDDTEKLIKEAVALLVKSN